MIISEGLYLEKVSPDHLLLQYDPDGSCIMILPGEIDDMIGVMRRAKAHFQSVENSVEEKGKLARWGKAKTPTDIISNGGRKDCE